MTNVEWNQTFGDSFLLHLSNEERKYFALNPISPEWDQLTLYFDDDRWGAYHRVFVYFHENTIVKVINETQQFVNDHHIKCYGEDDTSIPTLNREFLLPLSDDGPMLPLSVYNIFSYYPCKHCSFRVYFEPNRTFMRLRNSPTMRTFPFGEIERISSIRNDEDFHTFTRYYMDSCPADYFDKLNHFREVEPQNVSYQPGDIFRMDYDRTRYCYGLILGEVNSLFLASGLPEEHWLRPLDALPTILVRVYQLITDDPNLSGEYLRDTPLGSTDICSNQDITTGIHTIVDHKILNANDLYFPLTCQKFIPHKSKKRYSLSVDWGFTHTTLKHSRLSTRLKRLLAGYSPIWGTFTDISPRQVMDEDFRSYNEKGDLCSSKNTELRNELFACLGLPDDCTFDRFAEIFGGLSTEELLAQK